MVHFVWRQFRVFLCKLRVEIKMLHGSCGLQLKWQQKISDSHELYRHYNPSLHLSSCFTMCGCRLFVFWSLGKAREQKLGGRATYFHILSLLHWFFCQVLSADYRKWELIVSSLIYTQFQQLQKASGGGRESHR